MRTQEIRPPGSPEPSLLRRRITRLVRAAIVALLLVGLSVSVKMPLLVMEPGPAPDLAGRTSLGAPTYPSRGSFHLTTTQIRDVEGTTLKSALGAMIDLYRAVVPRSSVYPTGYSRKNTEGVQAAQMAQSENAAAVAALSELGMPYEPDGVVVIQVLRESDAVHKLLAGDVIVGIDEDPVARLGDLHRAVAGHRIGDQVALSIRRGGQVQSIRVKTFDSPDRPGKAILGVSAAQHYKAPIEVTVENEDIGGPSAGLMLALSLYDLLGPDDLTGGRKIAGTGTIENRGARTGVVGEVGAIDQKVESARRIGARIFLAPKREAEAARKAAKPPMRVIPVGTLHEAIVALRRL